MRDKEKKTVFVGVSGGVDSSVSLAILKSQGFNVVGCFIKTWQPDFIECTWRTERRDAMRVCAQLDLPFITVDAVEEYREFVGEYFINEYKAGRTPNPDVMCNKEIKFGVFLKYALAHGADYVATGHYAISKEGRLFAGIDESKDQSYFLWTLTKEQLSHTIFPIGNLEKTEVRNLAKEFGLSTATKKDSQGVCFLGPIDMKEFLAHYIPKKVGDVLNTKGEVIGEHDGALFFTLGERHGFRITKKGITDNPTYVISRDLDKNTITVSENKQDNPDQKNYKEIKIENINWISGVSPEKDKKYLARLRYQQVLQPCKIEKDLIIFDDSQYLASAGQSIVVYDNNECLGGGIIV